MTLKAYMVFDRELEGEMAELIYAYNRNQARRIGLVNREACQDAVYFDIRARRVPEADALACKPTPYVEYEEPTLRQAGFGGEDCGERCCSCGLWEFEREEWAVCLKCYQCCECGHDEECEDAE